MNARLEISAAASCDVTHRYLIGYDEDVTGGGGRIYTPVVIGPTQWLRWKAYLIHSFNKPHLLAKTNSYFKRTGPPLPSWLG